MSPVDRQLSVEAILHHVSAHAFYDFNWADSLSEDDSRRFLDILLRVAVEFPQASFFDVLHTARHKFAMRHITK